MHSWLGTVFFKIQSSTEFCSWEGLGSPHWWRQGLICDHTLKRSKARQKTRTRGSLHHGKTGGKRRGTTNNDTGFADMTSATAPPSRQHSTSGNWASAASQRKWALKPTHESKSYQLEAHDLPITSGCLAIYSHSLVNPHNHRNKLIYDKHTSSLRNMSASSDRFLLSSSNALHFYFQGHL